MTMRLNIIMLTFSSLICLDYSIPRCFNRQSEKFKKISLPDSSAGVPSQGSSFHMVMVTHTHTDMPYSMVHA